MVLAFRVYGGVRGVLQDVSTAPRAARVRGSLSQSDLGLGPRRLTYRLVRRISRPTLTFPSLVGLSLPKARLSRVQPEVRDVIFCTGVSGALS